MIRIRCYEQSGAETKERRMLNRCARCLRGKQEVPRLLTCSGCKAARYCSTECQKVHWRTHRVRCRLDHDRRARAEQVDYQLLSDLSLVPAAQAAKHSAVMPEQLHDELRVFADRFMPALITTGYSSMVRPAHTTPGAPNSRPLLFVLLERLLDDGLPTYPWSRFRVTFVGDMELEHLVDFFGDESIRRLLPAGRTSGSGDEEKITMVLSSICFATTPSTPVNYTPVVTLTKEQITDIEVREDWRNWFKVFVQRSCGHPPSMPTSPETLSTA